LSGRSLDVIVSIISLLVVGRVVSGWLTVTQLDTDAHRDAAAAHEVARYVDDNDNDQDDTDRYGNHCP